MGGKWSNGSQMGFLLGLGKLVGNRELERQGRMFKAGAATEVDIEAGIYRVVQRTRGGI